jgi:hypothetical protein
VRQLMAFSHRLTLKGPPTRWVGANVLHRAKTRGPCCDENAVMAVVQAQSECGHRKVEMRIWESRQNLGAMTCDQSAVIRGTKRRRFSIFSAISVISASLSPRLVQP